MVVERGGLSYPIIVQDKFGGVIKEFRTQIKGLVAEVKEYRAVLKDRSDVALPEEKLEASLTRLERALRKANKLAREQATANKQNAQAQAEAAAAADAAAAAEQKRAQATRGAAAAAKEDAEQSSFQARALSSVSAAAQQAATALGTIQRSSTPGLVGQFQDLAAAVARVSSQFSAARATSQEFQNEILSLATAEEVLSAAHSRIVGSLLQRVVLEETARQKVAEGIALSREEAEALGSDALSAFELAEAQKRLDVERKKATSSAAAAIERINAETRALEQQRLEALRLSEEKDKLLKTTRLPAAERTDLNLRAEAALQQQLNQVEFEKAKQRVAALIPEFNALGDAAKRSAESLNLQSRALQVVNEAAKQAGASIKTVQGPGVTGIVGQFQDLAAAAGSVAREFSLTVQTSNELRAAVLSQASAEELLAEAQNRILAALRSKAALQVQAKLAQEQGIPLTRQEAEALGKDALATYDLNEAKKRLLETQQRLADPRYQQVEELNAEAAALKRVAAEARKAAEERERLRAASGLPTAQQTDVNLRAEDQLRNELAALELRKAREELIKTDSRFAALADTSKTLANRINRVSFTFRRLFGILAAFTIARRIVQAFNELIAGSVSFNAQLEQAELGVGTIIAATSRIRDPFGQAVEGADKLNLALAEGQRQIQLLRKDALNTTATFEELVKAFQVAIGPGIQAGLGLDQIREFTLRISQAAQTIGLAQNQLAEEVRSLLEGTIQTRTTRIATVLGITNEDINLAKEAGNLFELLQSRFQAFELAAERAGNTFVASIARARDAVFQLAATANEPLFEELRSLFGDVRRGALAGGVGGIPIQANPEAVASIRAVGEGLAEAVRQARRFLAAFDSEELTGIFRGLGGLISGTAVAFEALAEGIVKGFSNVASLVDNIIRGVTLFLGITRESTEGFQSIVTSITEIVTTVLGLIVVTNLWKKTTAGVVTLYEFLKKNAVLTSVLNFIKAASVYTALWSKQIFTAAGGTLALGAASTALGAAWKGLLLAFKPLLPLFLILGSVALVGNITKVLFGVDLLAQALKGVASFLGSAFDVLTLGLFNSSLDTSVSLTDDLAQSTGDFSKAITNAVDRAKELKESLEDIKTSTREAARDFQVQQAAFGVEGAAGRQITTATETQLELSEKLQKAQEEITSLAKQETQERARQASLLDAASGARGVQYLDQLVFSSQALLNSQTSLKKLLEDRKTLTSLQNLSAAQEDRLTAVNSQIEKEKELQLLLEKQQKAIFDQALFLREGETQQENRKQTARLLDLVDKTVTSRNIEKDLSEQRRDLEKDIEETQKRINKLIEFRVAALGLPEIAQREKDLATILEEIDAQEKLNAAKAAGDEATIIRAEADAQIASIRRKAQEEAKVLRIQADQLDLLRKQSTDQFVIATLQEQADLARALASAVLRKATNEANQEDIEAKNKLLELDEKIAETAAKEAEREEIRIARGARRLEQLRQETRELESQRIASEAASVARAREAALAARGISGQGFVERADLEAQQRAQQLQIENLKATQGVELAILKIREKYATLSGRTAEAEALRAEILETEKLTREQILSLEAQLNQLGISYNQQLELQANRRTFQLQESSVLLRDQLVGQQKYLDALVTGNDYLVQRASLEADITQEALARQQAFSQTQARVQELLILRDLATNAKAREAIEKEINATLEEGNLKRLKSLQTSRELQIELAKLKQRAEEPVKFGVLEAINQLSGDGLRNFNLFFDATRDIVSGFAQTSAQQFANIFNPDENTDAVAEFARFFQTVGTQYLGKAFEGLLADLLQELGLDLAEEQASNAAFQASASTAGSTFAIEVVSAGDAFLSQALIAANAIVGAAAALAAAAAALAAAAAGQAVLGGVSKAASGVFSGTGNLFDSFFHDGGLVRGYARGGSVSPFPRPAHIHPKDTVPAWLQPKEYVMPVSSVSKYGLSIFDALRRRLLDPKLVDALVGSSGSSRIVSSSSRVLGFQSGGPVPSISGSSSRSDQRPLVVPAIPATEATLAALIEGGDNYLLRWLDSNGIRPSDARER